MINTMIKSICVAINKEFGDHYGIYTKRTEQGFQGPYFLVQCLNSKREPFLGNRYLSKNQFSIQYVPEKVDGSVTSNQVGERLQDCLQYITLEGDLLRGVKMHREESDGTLSCFVNYDLFLIKYPDKIDFMDKIVTNTDLKGV